ncbi:hypothetical protein AN396_13575 [Candidatus Epulonipiscium fishelsonii]|uniref:Uncharacterized protein n=1 Tax=Candidatus Epulonipiscium fishelsonii TaxID=77094 RepID=A0ACC8XGH4_9FIRM|nr:hypothetical protein AN396_13575 [Epulopiscium sp. SCG-B11WGA-EpuloA1]
MANILDDNMNELDAIDYNKVLNILNENLNFIEIEQNNNYLEFKNFSWIINQTMKKLMSSQNILSALGISNKCKAEFMSLNHANHDKFIVCIKNAEKILTVPDINVSNIAKLNRLNNNKFSQYNFGTNYTFPSENFNKSKITFDKNDNIELLRSDCVTIETNLKDLEEQFKSNILKNLEKDLEEDIEEISEEVNKGNFKVSQILNFLDTETLGKVKRTIGYLYLEHIISGVKHKSEHNYKYAYNYVKRFKLLEDYLLKMLQEGNSEITANDEVINLCEILSDGTAFDSLPFIGKTEGVFLEEKDENQKIFKLSLRLKLNGMVQNNTLIPNASSYVYHLETLKSDCKESIKLKSKIRKFFLYSFMFTNLNDDSFDPTENWPKIKDMLDKKGLDETLNKFVKVYLAPEKIKVVEAIKKVLNNELKSKTLSSTEYIKNLILYRGILTPNREYEHILNKGSIFQELIKEQYGTHYLKYISILDSDNDLENSLINIPFKITIETKVLSKVQNQEYTTIKYDLSDKLILPIVLYPKTSKSIPVLEQFKDCYYLRISYGFSENTLTEDSFIIKLVLYLTLVYLVIKKILKQLDIKNNKDIYVPFLRLHSSNQQNTAPKVCELVRSISKTLEHVFSVDYRSMSQGFTYDNNKPFIKSNALSSLYNRVNREFELKNLELEKSAIIVVTSRVTDGSKHTTQDIKLILGEVILFDKLPNGKIICDSWKTFADYYSNKEIFDKPTVINDIIQELYKKDYKNIVYIAKSPYSSNLDITKKKQNLYFMNEEIFENTVKDKKDLNLYPLYFETYSAIDLYPKNLLEAFYIDDTQHLDENLINNNWTIRSVLNLYSGKAINIKDTSYKSVIIYSTLQNIYKDSKLNQTILDGVIKPSNTKKLITEILMMLHYIRYEATRNRTIKVNPYERLIGDDGVGTKSIVECIVDCNKIKFNMLAYLINMQKIIDVRS